MNPEEPKQPAEPLLNDRWLDEVLERYSAVSPRAGLENRILANLEAHATQQRGRRWIFGLAAASAAVLLFAILIANTRNVKQDGPVDITARKAPPSEGVPRNTDKRVISESQTAGLRIVHQHRVNGQQNRTTSGSVLRVAEAKQEHFPADRPLSEQERLLQLYLKQTSQQELEHVVAQQQELAAARQRLEEELSSPETR